MKVDKILIKGVLYYTSRYYAKKSNEYNRNKMVVKDKKTGLFLIIDKKEFGVFLYGKN